MKPNKPIYQESEDGNFTHNGRKYRLNSVLEIVHHRPTMTVKVNDLSWILEYGYEVINGQKICHSCRKGTIGWHEERVDNADLTIPIIITIEENKSIVLDGVHRLEKAVRSGISEIPAKIISKAELAKCLRNQSELEAA